MAVSYRDRFKHWDDVADKYAAYECQFPASEEDDNHGVPVVIVNDMQELEDEDEFVSMLEAKMLEADCGIIKVKLPPEYVTKLRAVPQYPRLRNLHVTIEREEMIKYGSDKGVYIRNHHAHIESTTYETFYAPTMADGYGVPFKAKPGSSWHDAEDELWERIRSNGNRKAVYAPEIDGSLYPQTFEPLNINNFTGILRKIKMVQGIVPGISHSMTYLGRAAATFPWHVEDEMLYSFNYHHFGAGKVWYAGAANQYDEMVDAFKALYPEEYIHCKNAHMHKEFFVHPDVLKRRFGLKMVKTVQRPGELICTRPYGFHAGFSLGWNAAEASNWGNRPLWFENVAKDVRKKHLYCDCPLNRTVILNHQCVDHPDVRRLKKRVSELESTVESLAHAVELLKTSVPGPTSRGHSQAAAKKEVGADQKFDACGGTERKKPGRRPGQKNPEGHNAGGFRPNSGRKRKADDSDDAPCPSSSPSDADYADAFEG